jgi:tight adherence protein B
LTFLAAATAVAGIYSILSDLFLRDRSRLNERLEREFRSKQREDAKKSALFRDLDAIRKLAAEGEEIRPSLSQRFAALVEQSGLTLTPQRLLLIMALGGLVLAAPLGLIWQSIPLALSGLAVGLAVPFCVVLWKRHQRIEKMTSQLPDTFDLMARVIRAGQTMSQAMQAVADEFDPPIANEFAICYEQMNLGLPLDVSLRDLARRTGLLEVKIFVLGVLIQQQTGGNLAELLEKLAKVIRDRFRIRAKVRALTAEGRFQAIVLLALPPVLLALILLINRRYGMVIFDHPNILVAMLISEFLGALWIRKIVNFDF